MKRVNFAWQEFWYGFDTLQEAEKFLGEAMKKDGWHIDSNIYDTGCDIGRYEVRVKKPIRNYDTGY